MQGDQYETAPGKQRRDVSGMLKTPLPLVDDPEGERVPPELPPVVDAHIHLFPDHLFTSIWGWFERFGWPIRYRLKAPEVIDFLLSRGIRHLVALQYAHKPGVARALNRFMAKITETHLQVTAFASVYPGEPDDVDILKEAFSRGLDGVKLHAHVQCFDMESPAMHRIYAVCETEDKPLLMHVGREPKSPAYACDPYALCKADKVERILEAYPHLRICVPHLGADEFTAYRSMLERHDNLWVDTTMMLADYLPVEWLPPLHTLRGDRVLYGTDFPHIPYAWDRELTRLAGLGLADARLERILSRNAWEFLGLSAGSG